MKNINIYTSIVLLLAVSFYSSKAVAQKDFLVIANNSLQQDVINQNELRKIYFGLTTQWKDQKKIKPSHVEIGIDDFWSYISTTKRSYKSSWTKKVFSGNGVAPVEFESAQDVIQYVESTNGAVGVIPVSFRNKASANCKVISIQ